MKQNAKRSQLILAMCIFGTVGILRRYISLPSALIALVRGLIGAAFLIGFLVVTRKKLNRAAIARNFPLLLFSGAAIGFNWIALFESYCYTSVATATLCYYLAPVLVILGAPMAVGEKLTLRKGLCALAALVGMVFVSGVSVTGFTHLTEVKGILFGLGAAVLYASVVLMNKKMTDIPVMDRTVLQLLFASVALAPYVMLTSSPAGLHCEPVSAVLLCILGAVHTGFAYLLYFGSMDGLQAHTVALFSYIDPVLAILLSALLLGEPLTPAGILGAVLIIGAALFSELP